ncbi:hypothetical protein DY000_02024290 [Brassica cretica]|uniref:Transmembrane protein n=1 Tax=Brassica cretica TaxID=69181 RepID=A0ABQ7EIR0_BRACR|nr:hypothetical protein DY000_02024290 [Brassica cretica]
MTAPRFADFVLSPLPSLFSHLVVAFIAVCVVSGLKLELWFLGGWLLFSLPQVVSLLPLLPLLVVVLLVLYACVFLREFNLPVIILPLTRFLGSLRWCLIALLCVWELLCLRFYLSTLFLHLLVLAKEDDVKVINETWLDTDDGVEITDSSHDHDKSSSSSNSSSVITVISMPSQNVPVAGDAMFMGYIANVIVERRI